MSVGGGGVGGVGGGGSGGGRRGAMSKRVLSVGVDPHRSPAPRCGSRLNSGDAARAVGLRVFSLLVARLRHQTHTRARARACSRRLVAAAVAVLSKRRANDETMGAAHQMREAACESCR